jgi:hypothetical protein
METVVVGVDGSEPSRAALKHAAEYHPGATVHVPEATTEGLGKSGVVEGGPNGAEGSYSTEPPRGVIRRAVSSYRRALAVVPVFLLPDGRDV